MIYVNKNQIQALNSIFVILYLVICHFMYFITYYIINMDNEQLLNQKHKNESFTYK